MEGSEELFRPTRPPEVVESAVDAVGLRPRYHHLYVTAEELDLLIGAVQLARYPEKARTMQPLTTFDRLADLRLKLEEARQQ
jgi:hypothetical protein